MSALLAPEPDAFAEPRAEFEGIESFLKSQEAHEMSHSDLERELEKRGRELMRQLLQSHLEVRGPGKTAEPVKGSDGVERRRERLQGRDLETVCGEVRVERVSYGAEGVDSLHPLDAELNLPQERYSHEVRRRAAEEAAKGSYQEVVAMLTKTTGAQVGKRQVEELVMRAAADFDGFYQERYEYRRPEETGSILVITADGKGVVVRRKDLREATQKRAEKSGHKMARRLSPGEKPNKKRMGTVAGVYTIAPYERTAEEVLRCLAPSNAAEKPDRPRPESKRVWASLEKAPKEVIQEAFREARTRDREGRKRWVALVDGNETQLKILQKCFEKEGYAALIVLDFIHVAERVWKAGLDFYNQGPALETWVTQRLLGILHGRGGHVAAGMRRSATLNGLSKKARHRVDSCANYLLKYKSYMQYAYYLTLGLPIATGVIEGACRYLVKDRMEITGARWSLKGAEAVLRLRALRACGDFDSYWRFHEQQEYQRNHIAQYADGKVARVHRPRRHLRRIK
jgi:hypothetical protein